MTSDEADASSTTEPDAGIHSPTSSTTLAAGGLDIDVPEGFTAIPLPSAGFGLAIPDGWEAAVLTDESLARLEALEASPPSSLQHATRRRRERTSTQPAPTRRAGWPT